MSNEHDSPWAEETPVEKRSETMVRRLTEKLAPDTSLLELNRSHSSNGQTAYVRRLEVAHLTDAGWVDLYIGEVANMGRDALRHVALSGSDMTTLMVAYCLRNPDAYAELKRQLADQPFTPTGAVFSDTLMMYGVQFKVGDVLTDKNGTLMTIERLYESGDNRYADVTLNKGTERQRAIGLVLMTTLARQVINNELSWLGEDSATVCRHCNRDAGPENISTARICVECWRNVPISTLQELHGAEDAMHAALELDYPSARG